MMLTLLLACAPEHRAHVPLTDTLSVQANGLEFHYYEQGAGPLVILVHGFPDTATTWDDVAPAIAAEGFRVVTPFTRGIAPTEAPAQDTDHLDMAEDVLALIDALGEESAILVGHDWGAMHVMGAAYLEPDRVDKLVTVAIPHPDTLDAGLGLLWDGRHFVYLIRPDAVALMQRNDFQHVNELYARWAPSWDVSEAELDSVKNSYALESSVDAALGYYRGAGLGTPEFWAGDLSMPTMMVGGEEDMVDPAAFAASSAFVSGPFESHVIGGGHFPHREDPDTFTQLLVDFVTD